MKLAHCIYNLTLILDPRIETVMIKLTTLGLILPVEVVTALVWHDCYQSVFQTIIGVTLLLQIY